MSLERDFIQRGSYLLRDTRAALAEQELDRQAPGQFTQAYQQAEAYEAQVMSSKGLNIIVLASPGSSKQS